MPDTNIEPAEISQIAWFLRRLAETAEMPGDACQLLKAASLIDGLQTDDWSATASVFAIANALHAAQTHAAQLDDLRAGIEDLAKDLSDEISEAKGQLEGLKALALGRPTCLAELLSYFEEHPWVQLFDYRPKAKHRPMKFLRRFDGTLRFEEELAGGPIVTMFRELHPEFDYDGFSIDDFGTRKAFRYIDAPDGAYGDGTAPTDQPPADPAGV